jgi:hypothetical protein
MPPPKSGPPLAREQVDLIKRWIDQGAKWGAHWSFTPPDRPQPPTVKQSAWPKNDIDRFVLARLEREQLAPSPAADRVTLIRRVSLDLTGVPPTSNQPPLLDAHAATVEVGCLPGIAGECVQAPIIDGQVHWDQSKGDLLFTLRSVKDADPDDVLYAYWSVGREPADSDYRPDERQLTVNTDNSTRTVSYRFTQAHANDVDLARGQVSTDGGLPVSERPYLVEVLVSDRRDERQNAKDFPADAAFDRWQWVVVRTTSGVQP